MIFRKSTLLALFFSSSVNCIWAAVPVDVAVTKKMPQENALDRFNAFKYMAIEKTGALRKHGVVRKVKKDGQPKIVLTHNQIYFNEMEIKIGNSLASWKEIIDGNPRCMVSSIIYCIWDDLGLEVGTDNEIDQRVRFVNLHLSFSEEEKTLTRVKSRSPAEKGLRYSPDKVFPGYIELDGFGIDANTEFWEIRAAANNKNKIHCGLRDCSHPSGPFGSYANIYLTLDGPRETNKVLELSLSVSD